MRIMIFGGCGFIGSHVVDLLHKSESNKLFVFDDLSTGKLENIRHLITTKHNSRLNFDMLDIKRQDHVDDAMRRFHPDTVIVLAAQAAISVSENNPQLDANTNIGGMLNVISAAKKINVYRIIFSSTSAVYREKHGKLKETDPCQPGSPYGISKMAAEHYLRNLFLSSVILRFGNVYGPRQVPIGENQVIPRAIKHFECGDEFKVFGDGNQTRDYVYVEDVAQAVQDSIYGRLGTYNIATGQRLSVNQVLDTLSELYELPKNYPWQHREAPDPRGDICLDVRAANEYLGWKARVPFKEGLKRTVDWWTNKEPVKEKVGT